MSFVFLLSVVSRKARAVYPCEAEHSSELSFEIGAIFEDGKCRWELGGGSLVVGCSLSPQNVYDPQQAVTGCSVVRVTSPCLTLRAGESWPVGLSGTGRRALCLGGRRTPSALIVAVFQLF